MIILKKKSKNYYAYIRKSFRDENNKVKKKDTYLFPITEDEINQRKYLDWGIILHHGDSDKRLVKIKSKLDQYPHLIEEIDIATSRLEIKNCYKFETKEEILLLLKSLPTTW